MPTLLLLPFPLLKDLSSSGSVVCTLSPPCTPHRPVLLTALYPMYPYRIWKSSPTRHKSEVSRN